MMTFRAQVNVSARLAAILSGVTFALWVSDRARSAEMLLVNGHIYTANTSAPWAEAIAIDKGRITAAGTSDEVRKQAGASAKTIDLKKATVIPGIIDGHVHSLFGSMALHGVNLWATERSILPAQREEFVGALKSYADSHKAEKIIFARAVFSTRAGMMPTHDPLDEAVPDRPLIVHEVGEHALWLNVRALELAGVTSNKVQDETQEKGIVRDSSGKPTGILLEAAMELAEQAILKTLPEEEKLEILAAGTRYLNSFGITSVVNATGNLGEIRLYGKLRDRGQLTVRTRTAFGAVAVPHRLSERFLSDLDTARAEYHDDWVSANLVKFFADGGTGDVPPLVYDPADYRKLVLELDKRGFQLMTHALRADSVHMILDAYDAVEKQNGPRDRRLRIEHADLVEDRDLSRFAQLHVIASMQPSFCCSAGSYGGGQQPDDRWASMLSRNAMLAFSSDWPCTWPPNPFVAMGETVTRFEWEGESYGAGQGARKITQKVKDPGERISITSAVDAYTRNAAYASFKDKDIGTLAVGKYADLVVLSQDIFAVRPDQVAGTHPVMTMVGGKMVYGNLN